MGDTMKIKAHIYAMYMEHSKDFYYTTTDTLLDDKSALIFIETKELEFDAIPRDVLINRTVDAYRAEQSRVRAEAQTNVNKLQETINTMLAIENKAQA